jgi:hypothetical protein
MARQSRTKDRPRNLLSAKLMSAPVLSQEPLILISSRVAATSHKAVIGLPELRRAVIQLVGAATDPVVRWFSGHEPRR